MKVGFQSISQVTDLDSLRRYIAISFQTIQTALGNELSFSDNINCKIISVQFGAPNSDVTVAHLLGRPPIGYIPIRLSAAMTLFDGTKNPTSSNITLQSSAEGNAQVLFF